MPVRVLMRRRIARVVVIVWCRNRVLFLFGGVDHLSEAACTHLLSLQLYQLLLDLLFDCGHFDLQPRLHKLSSVSNGRNHTRMLLLVQLRDDARAAHSLLEPFTPRGLLLSELEVVEHGHTTNLIYIVRRLIELVL